ncbi:MAG: LysM peptidoglycan-binding domain-containing protein [Candidatus Binataceae bacterium]
MKLRLTLLAFGLMLLASTAIAAPSDYDDAGGQTANDASAAAPTPVQAHHNGSFLYTIRSGDTLGSISNQFGVPIDELARVNHLNEEADLYVGANLRIPNPFVAHDRQLNLQIDRLSNENRAITEKAAKAGSAVATLQSKVGGLSASNAEYAHALRTLPWWRGASFTAMAAALVMLGVMLVALIEWWILRSRFRAVAEMNDSLRRLDYKYKAALAKAELRLQALYGRRRKGIQDGQERAKIPEELEIEHLNHELKEILEHHLERLGPPTRRAHRARWRELLGGIGSPVEARSARR